MKTNQATGIVILMVVLIVGLIYMLHEPSYNWYSHDYMEEGDSSIEPYGNQLFYEYLKTQRPEDQFHQLDSAIHIDLQPFVDSAVTDYNYVIMGRFPAKPDSADMESFFNFVAQGNSVFIYSEDPKEWLMDELHSSECLLYWPDYSYGYSNPNYINDSVVQVNFTHPELSVDSGYRFAHRVESHLEKHQWMHANPDMFCEDNLSFASLGTLNDQVNFVRVLYGEGAVHIHFTPKLFSNYYLTKQVGRDYVDASLAHLSEGDIIYDMKSWSGNPFWQGENSHEQSQGPLRFILSQESLRWGLYTLFGIAGLLVVFAFTRKQRVIPVIHPKENSSMEYVETITELYFQHGGQGRVHKHLTDQFRLFLRERYRLTSSETDEDYTSQIAQVSGVHEDHINDIIRTMNKGSVNYNVTSDLLIEYYKLLNHFYEHCK